MNAIATAEAPPTAAQELVRALRACTPKERKWLKALPKYDYQRWRAAEMIGLSSHTLHAMLRRERVQRALHLLETMAIEELGITHRMILQEYTRLARSRLDDFYNADGSLKLPHEWTDDQAAAVAELSYNEHGKPKVKLHEKKGALDALAKFRQTLGTDRLELTGKNGAPLPATQVVVMVGGEEARAIARELVDKI